MPALPVISRKHTRLRTAVRKTAKWGGAVVTVLLLVAWIGSVWWSFAWSNGGGGGSALAGGCVTVAEPFFVWQPDRSFSGYGRSGTPFDWGFDQRDVNGIRASTVPVWFPALVSLVVTFVAWRADAKQRRRAVLVGLCPLLRLRPGRARGGRGVPGVPGQSHSPNPRTLRR